MGLKGMVKNDIKNIFLNVEEFGEVHTVDGKEITIIVDDNELAEREKKAKALAEGIHLRQVLIYVPAEDFGPEPPIDRLLELDGEYYRVTDVSNEAGIYAISLEANRA